MLVIVTYDVSTVTSAGQRRLREVSKICQSYGQRVQNSVFECVVDSAQLAVLRMKLLDVIDQEQDSLRIYRMGNHYQDKIEHFGVKQSFDMEGLLIL